LFTIATLIIHYYRYSSIVPGYFYRIAERKGRRSKVAIRNTAIANRINYKCIALGTMHLYKV